MFAFLLVLLLLATPVQAGMVIGSGTAGAPDHCPSCVGDDADVLCEDFENAGTGPVCAGWTINDDGDGSVTFEAHPADIATCTDEGDYAMKIVYVGTDVDQFAAYDMGEAKDHIFVQGWFYVDSTDIAAGDEFILIEGSHAVEGSQDFRVYFKMHAGGTYYVVDAAAWKGAAFTNLADGTSELALDTWYRLVIEYDDDEAIRVWVNGTLEIEDTGIDGGKDTRYIYLNGYAASAFSRTVWWDNIKIDATAAPGDCG